MPPPPPAPAPVEEEAPAACAEPSPQPPANPPPKAVAGEDRPPAVQWADPPLQDAPPAPRAQRRGSLITDLAGEVRLLPARLAAPPTLPDAAAPPEPPPPEPPAPVRAFRRLLADLSQTRHDGVGLSLSDPDLGAIRFAIVTEGSSVVITVTAERPETRSLMQSHAQDLLQSLRQAGFRTAILNWGRPGRRDAGAQATGADPPIPEEDAPLDLLL